MEHIKVVFKGEGMFVKVESIDGNHATGKLDNYPINASAHGYRFGDDVTCKREKRYPDLPAEWYPIYEVNPSVSTGDDSQLIAKCERCQAVFDESDLEAMWENGTHVEGCSPISTPDGMVGGYEVKLVSCVHCGHEFEAEDALE